jgi:hypothetical protein
MTFLFLYFSAIKRFHKISNMSIKYHKKSIYPWSQETIQGIQKEANQDSWHTKERSQEGCQEGIMCCYKDP